MRNVFISKVQLAFGNEEGIVSLCLNDDTTECSVCCIKDKTKSAKVAIFQREKVTND